MTRFIGPSGSGRRRRTLFGAFVAFMLLSLLIIPNAFAVHDETFQLDADVIASTQTTVGGSTQTEDWDSIFDANGVKKDPLPAGFTAATFEKDFVTAANGGFSTTDSSTYATGSKDTLPITPGWQCNRDANVNSKIDIMNAYAAAYTASSGDEILYFALERNTNTGDANVGFWFLQGEVACESPGGNTPFTGDHADGDLLIVSAFTNGGTVSTIDVYRWNGGANGSLGTTPVAHGVDCRDPATGTDDPVCAVSNTADITTPWPTATKQDGVGNTLRTSDFFEGGLNLTDKGLGNRCFNTFTGVTRSSQSLTATLFDFALGQLGECTSTTDTTPVDAADNTKPPASSIPLDPNDAKVEVKDKTVIDVTGVDSFDGSISWHICGPTAANSTATCDVGGVDVGSLDITVEGTYYSPKVTVTAAGRYCFRAEFSGDDSVGVPPSSDHDASECFVVNPVQPTLTTDASDGPVAFGQPISDQVTLTGTAHKPGTGGPSGSDGSINPTTFGGDATGNIVVKAFGPDSCSTVAFTSQPIAASGDGTYGGTGTAFEFTPTSPGQYIFVASYAGDLPNTLGIAESACSAAPDVEKVTVRQIPTTISTTQSVYPNDSATIASTVVGDNLPSGGTVIFRLYDNATCTDDDDVVGTTGLLYKETKNNVGGANSVTVSTSNTTVAVSANGAYYWRVTYATGDSAHTGRQSDCVENTVLTFNNDSGPGTLFP
jgi:hypothetical protein